METMRCETCGTEEQTPRHCGKPMHEEAVDGKPMLVCWMGAGCSTQAIPQHCGKPMRAATSG